MIFVLDALIEVLERGDSAVLGTIVRSSGSTPRTSGAHMLLQSDGTLTGTIGGGSIEGDCQKRAQELFYQPESYAEVNFSLSAMTLAEEGMVCGGAASVLLQKVEPGSLDIMVQMRNDYKNGERPVLLIQMPTSEMPPQLMCLGLNSNHLVDDGLGQQISQKIRRSPFMVKNGDHEMFVQPLVSPGVVYLIGAGHVALATAHLASFSGFEVVVMDDRAEFVSETRYPQAKEVIVVESFDGCLKNLSSDDYVVIVTRGHLHDRNVLAQALRTNAGYIGMIGSRKKRNVIYNSLREEGFDGADLKRVHSPIGLSIGADTPNEIALSIVAELVKARSEKEALF